MDALHNEDSTTAMQLLCAAQTTGPDRLRALVSARGERDRSCLSLAVKCGSTDLVAQILEAADQVDAAGCVPLNAPPFFALLAQSSALQAAQPSTASALLTATDASGRTPLLLAIECSSGDMVAQLLAAGAQADVAAGSTGAPRLTTLRAMLTAKDESGNSVLVLAVLYSSKEKVVHLLEAAAQVDAAAAQVVRSEPSPRAVAHSSSGPQAAEPSTLSALLTATDAAKRTPLLLAVEFSDGAIVEQLLGAGAGHLDPAHQQAAPALQLAATRGDTTSVQLLLHAGVPADVRGLRGSTPLQTAAWFGHAGVVQALLGAGADVWQRDADQSTPLMLAVSGWHVAAVDALLCGAAQTVNAVDRHDETALQRGASSHAAAA